MNGLRKWLILAHRYLGIALGLLFLIWFVSGLAMTYTRGMPELTAAARLERLPQLDLSRIHIGTSEAIARAGIGDGPDRVTIVTVLDRPAYRLDEITVFADTGDRLPPVNARVSRSIAARFLQTEPAELSGGEILEAPDQWMLTHRHLLPVHKFITQTWLYIDPMGSRIVASFSHKERVQRWLYRGLHSLDFPALFRHRPLWHGVIVALSLGGTLLSAIGVVIGVRRLTRWPRRAVRR
jgi:hypothetical protein